MKTCAFCTKPIEDAAVACPHCGQEWGAAAPLAVRADRLAILVAIALLMFVGTGVWLREARVHHPSAEKSRTPVAQM
jgi:hypothetical protein